MNDLEVIDRRNAESILNNVPSLQAKGCWVVVERAGLACIGAESFSGEGAEQRARAKLEELSAAGASTHGELYEPTASDAHNSDRVAA